MVAITGNRTWSTSEQRPSPGRCRRCYRWQVTCWVTETIHSVPQWLPAHRRRAASTSTLSCPSCQPAGTGFINLWTHSGSCGDYTNENDWYSTWKDSHDTNHVQAAPYIPGQPLAFQCPIGIPAGSTGSGGSTGGSGGGSSGGTPSGALGLIGSSSYQFAYIVQGPTLNIQSGAPNWYGNWTVIVNGSITLAEAPTTSPTSSQGYLIVNATGTRIFIDGTGAVTTQSIIGVASGSNVQPSYVYAPSSGSFVDGTYGWSLLLSGSVATPMGPAVSNVLTLLQSNGPSFAPSALSLNVSNESFAEFWQVGPSMSPYIDSKLLVPLLLTNSSSAVASVVGNLSSTLLSAAAAQQAAAVLPPTAVSSSLQVYFQYRLSPINAALSSSSSFWQVCATGSLTIDTTRGAAIEGSIRYPVTGATGQRTFTQYGQSYYNILLQLVNGSSSTLAANSTVQTITGTAPVGLQGADDYVAFSPNATGTSLINVTNDGLGLLLSSPAVYATGSSWSPQVTLSLSTNNQNGVPLGTFALSEVYGPQSVGQLVASTSPLSCPAAAVSGAAVLPVSQMWLLVYALNYSTSPITNTPAFVCAVAELTVAGVTVDTQLGPASPILSVSGFHYAEYRNGGFDTQPLNSSISTSSLELLYTTAQSPSVVDVNGLDLQALNDPNLYFNFFYSSTTGQYVERGNSATLRASNVYLLPASQIAAVPIGEAACTYSPYAPVSVPSSSSSSSSSASSASSVVSPIVSSSSSAAPSTAAPSSTSTPGTTSATAGNTAASSATSAAGGGGGVTSSSSSSSSGGVSTPTSASSTPVGPAPGVSSSSSSSSTPASSSAAPPVASSSSSSGLSHGAIAGIVIGSVAGALLILLICLVLLLLARSGENKKQQPVSRSSDSSVVRPSMVAAAEPSHLVPVDTDVERSGVRPHRVELEMQQV